jgi:hypothetical protein
MRKQKCVHIYNKQKFELTDECIHQIYLKCVASNFFYFFFNYLIIIIIIIIIIIVTIIIIIYL